MKKNWTLIRTIIVIVAFIAAYLFDKFWISNNISFLSNIIRLKFEFNAPGIKNITIPSFGLIPVLFITLLIYTLMIIPYTNIRDRHEWKSIGGKIKKVLKGLLFIPFCMVIGGVLFLLFGWIFPDLAEKIAQAFGMTTSFYFFNSEDALITLEGSFASILGLLAGLIILTKRS